MSMLSREEWDNAGDTVKWTILQRLFEANDELLKHIHEMETGEHSVQTSIKIQALNNATEFFASIVRGMAKTPVADFDKQIVEAATTFEEYLSPKNFTANPLDTLRNS